MEKKVGQDCDLFLITIHSVLAALFVMSVGALSANSLGGEKSMHYDRPVGCHIHLEIRWQPRGASLSSNLLNFLARSSYHDIVALIRTFEKGLVNAMVFLSLDEPRMTSGNYSTCWFLGPTPCRWARFSKGVSGNMPFIRSFPGDPMLSKYKSWSSGESSLPVFIYMSLPLWPHTSISCELLLSHLCFEIPLFHSVSLWCYYLWHVSLPSVGLGPVHLIWCPQNSAWYVVKGMQCLLNGGDQLPSGGS